MPFQEHLKVRVAEAHRGRGTLEVTVRPEHLRDLGIMHGGMSAALLDAVMGMSAASLAPEGHHVVTVQLNVNFIRPAREGESLVASGEVIHSGRQTSVARGEIRTSEGALVSHGTATFMIVRHPAASSPGVPEEPRPADKS